MNAWNLGNAVLFQGAWFACVLGGARDSSLWGLALLAALAVFVLVRPHLTRDLVVAGVAGVLGFLLDTLWIHAGVLDYGGAALAPPWIVILWVCVGLTVNHSLSLFKQRPLLGGVLAGAAAPLSYLAGERLGAVTVPEPWALAFVSAAWLLVFALVFVWMGDNDRQTPVEEHP